MSDFESELKKAWATCACADGDCDETACHDETATAIWRERKDYHCRCCSPTVSRECTNPLHAALLEMVEAYALDTVSKPGNYHKKRRRLRAAVGVDDANKR